LRVRRDGRLSSNLQHTESSSASSST
jgi:hypothetical protein